MWVLFIIIFSLVFFFFAFHFLFCPSFLPPFIRSFPFCERVLFVCRFCLSIHFGFELTTMRFYYGIQKYCRSFHLHTFCRIMNLFNGKIIFHGNQVIHTPFKRVAQNCFHDNQRHFIFVFFLSLFTYIVCMFAGFFCILYAYAYVFSNELT